MRHEHTIISLLGHSWRENIEDRDAGYGIAIMLSFIEDGIRARVDDMARHIGVPIPEMGLAFERLRDAGYFMPEFDAKRDKALTYKTEETMVKCAWGMVAGIASGIIYRPYSNLPLSEKVKTKKEKTKKERKLDYDNYCKNR